MKRANLFLLLISLIIVIAACIFATGCLSSAIGRGGMPTEGDDIAQQQGDTFPPMYNYPKDNPTSQAGGNTGKFSPGDILAPDKGSSVYDPDLAVIVIRDTGEGSYEIDGVMRSSGTWVRLPDSVKGAISYSDVERLFPDKIGHMDIPSFVPGPGGRSR